MNHFKKVPYLNVIIAVILSYIGIKCIDNYTVFTDFLNQLLVVLAPFVTACIVAYILNPIMCFFEKKFKVKRGVSILLTYSLIIGLILIFSIYLMPKISQSIFDLARSMPEFAKQAQNWFYDIMHNSKGLSSINIKDFLMKNVVPTIPKFKDIVFSSANAILSGTMSFTLSFINVLFGFIIAIYLLFDKENFLSKCKKLIYIVLSKEPGDKLIEFFGNINYMVSTYIGIKAIDSLIIGIIAFIGLIILKSPYALLLAIIVGITNMIPYFGPFIGMAVSSTINLFFVPITALWVLIFLLLLQQFDGWYLDPKLIGGKVGISPFAIIFAVTVGGGFFGVLGMILSVPVMGVIKIYAEKLIEKKGWNKTDKATVIK